VLKNRKDDDVGDENNMAIQGWGDLVAFFRLSLGQAKIVVFLQAGALK
jgi:hypothetical protein